MSYVINSLFCLLLLSAFQPEDPWIRETEKGYTYNYQVPDQSRSTEYKKFLDAGLESVNRFFKRPFPKTFDVFVHPTRQSWDQKLQVTYQMPDFKSECWMVASGDGFQLNMISPVTWDTASCEHRFSDKVATQQLITHELFHVFHGQHNASPDFSELEGLDWLAEGFAAYASGQLTTDRMAGVKELVANGNSPALLDDFWKGKHRYGLSGSVVQYIDQQYGRETLFNLLAYKKKSEVLDKLKTSESDLLEGWKKEFR